MENYWKMTKDYVDSKLEDLHWQREKNYTGMWIAIFVAVGGLTLLCYRYRCSLAKKLTDEKSPNSDRNTSHEPSMQKPMEESGI